MKLALVVLLSPLLTAPAVFAMSGGRGVSVGTNSSKSKGAKHSKSQPALDKGSKSKGHKSDKGETKGGKYFRRISVFPICQQVDPTCNIDDETVAEIVVATEDGNNLVYTDSKQGLLGFVDITDPHYPKAAGSINVGGEPTSVAVCGDYAIVVVNTSPDFVSPSGIFHVIEIESQSVVRTGDLPGQPDSIGVSPDCHTAAVAIENERDEDLGDGSPPQMPPGSVVVMDISADDPADWILQDVDITGLDGVTFPDDPEPEYVAINEDHIAVVTLQENNAHVLIDTKTGEVLDSFSAGSVDLSHVDATEDGKIMQIEELDGVLREPDGVVWIDNRYYATADEGDLDGGSRGYTTYSKDGKVVYTSGNSLELLAASIGQYPDERSENKGNEPENVAFGRFGKDQLLFVNSERSSVVFVYDVKDLRKPELLQILPAGSGPEGVYAIPSRDLLVVASEVDERDNAIRSVINIYYKGFDEPSYPTLVSENRANGTPIPFAALSGLAACSGNKHRILKTGGVKKKGYRQSKAAKLTKRKKNQAKHDKLQVETKSKAKSSGRERKSRCDKDILYTVDDSFFKSNRIMAIDTKGKPPRLFAEYRIRDANQVFADALVTVGLGTAIAELINSDDTVNIDPEGIAVSEYHGGFWLVHEGAGTQGDPDRPFETPNVLFKLDDDAAIQDVILLPTEVNDIQRRFGFEGVAEYGPLVVVTFQREWGDESHPRIGVYDTESDEWKFYFYPLDAAESQNGGWVGLSDIASVGDGQFYVLERDNQGGPDAAIKRIYQIDLNEPSSELQVFSKTLVKDLYDDLAMATNGPIVEKVEGLAVTADGDVWIVNDNDGVDDNNGETLLLNLGEMH